MWSWRRLMPGWTRNMAQRSRSLSRVAEEQMALLRNSSERNAVESDRVSTASRQHKRETRALRLVLSDTLSRLAE